MEVLLSLLGHLTVLRPEKIREKHTGSVTAPCRSDRGS
jgi:hypothetical protein